MSGSNNAFDIMKNGAIQTYSTLHVSLHENKTVKFGKPPTNPIWSSKVLLCCVDRNGRVERRVQLHKTYQSTTDKFILKRSQPAINLHLLKSGLQKAVRRKETKKSINIASHIINQENGLCEICRRLPIIAIEDSSVNSMFPTMVWYMLASSYKSYEHDESDIEFILQFVYEITQSNIRDVINPTYNGDAPIIGPQESDIVNSILIREAYGGMKGDIRMLRHAAHIWTTRSLKLVPFSCAHATVRANTLSENDIPLSAFDFHCTNILDKVYSDISTDDMKTAMWIYSSSINLKTDNIHHKAIHTSDNQKFHNLINDDYVFIDATNQDEKNWCKIRQQIHSVAVHMRASYFER